MPHTPHIATFTIPVLFRGVFPINLFVVSLVSCYFFLHGSGKICILGGEKDVVR